MNSKTSSDSQRPRALADAAMISPSSVYEHPRQVVRSHVLTAEQKADILDQWESDAIAMQTAAGEGMTGGPPSRLDDVQRALTELREITAGRGAARSGDAGTAQPGAVHNDNGPDRQTMISGDDARQGVTGNNVRTILAVSLVGVVVSFVLVALYLGAL